jgi:hypothetical protein
MRRYYARLDPAGEPLVSEHLLALCLRDLDEAGRLAAERADVLARLDHLKQYQHYVRLRWDFDRTRDKEQKKELALAALTHCYRTRYAYMNHWAALQYSWSAKLAKDLEEPNLDWHAKDAAWKRDVPLSSQETDKLFRGDLERFRPQEVSERKFSTDLVPTGLTSPKPAETAQRFQAPGRYAAYSLQGEPLEFGITTGVIAWYRDRPDATLTVTDADGNEVYEERIVLDGQEHACKVKVAKAGLYWVNCNDSAAGWGIRAAAGRPLTLVLSARRGSSLGQMQRMYFFVPKGTPHLDYFWDGGPHEVLGPDGKLIAKVGERGKYIRIAVPSGMDGQAWSLSRLALGKLVFTNVPNYLAASPEALLVPREAKD